MTRHLPTLMLDRFPDLRAYVLDHGRETERLVDLLKGGEDRTFALPAGLVAL